LTTSPFLVPPELSEVMARLALDKDQALEAQKTQVRTAGGRSMGKDSRNSFNRVLWLSALRWWSFSLQHPLISFASISGYRQ
jgi:hypothetical protein